MKRTVMFVARSAFQHQLKNLKLSENKPSSLEIIKRNLFHTDHSMPSKLSLPEGEHFGLSSTGIMQLAVLRLLMLKFIFQVVAFVWIEIPA